MGKIEEKLLSDFRKANKTRKESLAAKFGFSNATEYENHLCGIRVEDKAEEAAVLGGKIVKQITVKPVIHIVNLLDNSRSMQGSKFDSAFAGVKEEVELLKKSNDATYTYSLFNFKSRGTKKPNMLLYNNPIDRVEIPDMRANTGTPLYATIVLIADTLLEKLNKSVKTLVKIFTDGRDEHSRYAKEAAIRSIKSMQEAGITVTFVCTEWDVKDIIKDLQIDESNTLVHNNTGEGVQEAFAASNNATIMYTKNVVAGKDVSKGFYKNIK